MALYKRQNTWWISISYQGRRIQESTGTSNKSAAREYYDRAKAELWRNARLGERPKFTWRDAVIRWTAESSHKRTLVDDQIRLRWLEPYFGGKLLQEIDKNLIEEAAQCKEKEGVRPATVNRMLEVIRAMLRKAEREWEWIDKTPVIRMRKEDNRRIRWITHEEADRLLNELPLHLKRMAAFSLATGLRQSNAMHLKWQDVDLNRRRAWVHPDEAKARKAIAVPLNETAMSVLKQQMGQHSEFVFTYAGKPVKQCSTKAWKSALKRAGIKCFRWHDLRHTWASWHVQNGTSLQELQLLGGWASYEMVLRYAHLNSDHLQKAAERVVYDVKGSERSNVVKNAAVLGLESERSATNLLQSTFA